MAKQSDCYFSKCKQKSAVIGISDNSDNDGQYSNLNLYLNRKCPVLIPAESCSKTNKNKHYVTQSQKVLRCTAATFKVPDSTVSDNHEGKGKLKAWNQSTFMCPNTVKLVGEVQEKVKKQWKKNDSSTKNSKSTLSLHIAAFENYVEDAASDSSGIVSNSIKIQQMCEDFTAVIQNTFEFPRQQENAESQAPEVAQQRASQRLLNPNELSTVTAEEMEIRLKEETKALFQPLLDEYVSNNRKGFIKTRDIFDHIVNVLQQAERDEKISRSQKDVYKIVQRYVKTETESGVKLSTVKGKKVACKDSIFDILYQLHHRKGHAGCNVMYNSKTVQKYEGITKPLILLFLKCCRSCELKKAGVRKSLVVNPILSSDYNARCQLDLIDLQSKPDGQFKFIFVYQDHMTKYVILRPLTQKSAAAVANELRQVFCDFGPPVILQTDNGREFSNTTIENLTKEFNCKLIHGKPRHSQSQGSVERANRDIQDILTIMLQRQNTSGWAKFLPEIQLKKNVRHHRGINCTPFRALFGRDSIYGADKDDFEEALARMGAKADEVEEECFEGSESLYVGCEAGDYDEDGGEDDDEGGGEDDEADGEDDDEADGEDDDEADGEDDDEADGEDDDEGRGEDESKVLELAESIQSTRASAREASKKQADKMVEASNKRFAPLKVGDNVRIPLPDVDRGKTDHRNIRGVVVAEQNGFYSVGTSAGVLKNSYARNQLVPVGQTFLTLQDVPQSAVRSLRTVANLTSSSGGQGHIHCNCTTGCQNKRCKCLSNARLCNSRCHNSHPCANKSDD